MTNNNIFSLSSRSCCGCGVCMSVCPQKAITVGIDNEGFFSPSVDTDMCIHCGICKTVCFKFADFTDVTTAMSDKKVIGAYSADKNIHSSTTSGGIAYEISRWGIEHGYKVFGVVYDYQTDCAKSVLVDCLSDLSLLKGSKYIQSNSAEALNILFEDARRNSDNKYICVGTPCQIFGLRKLIRQYLLQNEFVLVDLFCHGVPSYLVWHPYIAKQKERLGPLESINFRYKGNGWHQYTIRIKGSFGEYCKMAYRGDLFFNYFFDNIALNTSCYTCPVRKELVAADIRLGDFLGTEYEHREDGISAVLIATKKGKYIIDTLADEQRIVIDKTVDAQVCLTAQSTLDYTNIETRNRVISNLQKSSDIEQVYNIYFQQLPIKKRIRIKAKNLIAKLPLSFITKARKLSHLLTEKHSKQH